MTLFYKTGSINKTLLGILSGIFAGISFYFYIMFSTKLTTITSLSTIQILSLRFWALFIGSLFFLPFFLPKSTFIIIANKYIDFTIISIFSLVIPIFLTIKLYTS